jgi:hypothetical protein
MSETKFTKGEWVADIRIGCCAVYPSSSTDGWEQWLCDDAKNLFYKRYHNDFMNPECKNLAIEHVANANLIAAAPEMYAILETVLSEMYDLIDEVNDQRMSDSWQMQTPCIYTTVRRYMKFKCY